ncbi:2-dehydropantoate 2-reductase [Marinomonas agarivorans]|nr:2-dehydropantoate 2-reductase [Marinomonas agarivorans]
MQTNSHSNKISPPPPSSERWLVVGAGAMGLLWFCKLYKQGYQPVLLHRHATPLTHIEVMEADQTQRIPLQETTLVELEQSNQNFTHVLLCTKAFDLVQAYQQIATLVSPCAHILCLCNGMGAQSELLKQLKYDHQLFVGSTSEGVYKEARNRIQKKGTGNTFFGSLSNVNATPSLAIQMYCVDNIESKLFAKLAVNATINPLTALFLVKNGDLLNPPLSAIFYSCCAEVDSILHSINKEMGPYQAVTEDVAKQTQNNRSSMLQDVTYNRKTEIDFISGYLVQKAKKLNVAAPIQEHLVQFFSGKVTRETAQEWLLRRYS